MLNMSLSLFLGGIAVGLTAVAGIFAVASWVEKVNESQNYLE